MSTGYGVSRSARYAIVIAGMIALALLIYVGRDLIRPLIISGLLAYVLNPAVEMLTEHTRMRRSVAALIVYVLALAVLIAIPALTAPIMVREVRGLTLDFQRIEARVTALLAEPIFIAGIPIFSGASMTDAARLLAEAIAPAASSALDLVGGLTTNLIWILVILVTTYYLLRDGPRLAEWTIGLAPVGLRGDAARLLAEFDFVWSAYLRGQLTLSLIVGVLTSVATAAVGLPGALVLGLLAGILDVVPSLGPTVAGAISVVVALFLGSTYLPLSNFVFALIVLALFVLIQQIENIWLRPQIMGYALHVHPAIVFVSVLASLAMIGVLGALVSIPVVATCGIAGRYVHRRLLGRDPWAGVPERNATTVPADVAAAKPAAKTADESGRA